MRRLESKKSTEEDDQEKSEEDEEEAWNRNISEEEVKKVLSTIAGNKAAGKDGMGTVFWKALPKEGLEALHQIL